eukprot:1159696-Pelagomonas_calceolata.AAC.6
MNLRPSRKLKHLLKQASRDAAAGVRGGAQGLPEAARANAPAVRLVGRPHMGPATRPAPAPKRKWIGLVQALMCKDDDEKMKRPWVAQWKAMNNE